MSEVNTNAFVRHVELKKRPMRIGKTKRDRENNQSERNQANKEARVTWQKECKGSRAIGNKQFPLGSCNGKRSRSLKG